MHLDSEVDFSPIAIKIEPMHNADYKIGKELLEAIGEDMVKNGTINMDIIITLSQQTVHGNLGVYINRKDTEEIVTKGMLRAMRN